MPTTCSCPSCGCRLTLPDEQLGKAVVCGKCRTEFTVTDTSTEAPPATSQAIQVAEDSVPPNRPKPNPEIDRIADRSFEWQAGDDDDYPAERFAGRDLPGKGVTIALLILLGFFLFLEFALVAALGAEYLLLDPLARKRQPVPATPTLTEALINLLVVARSAVYLPTGIVFCVWTHRAYKNLPILHTRGLNTTPGMAVLNFLIPGINLFIPCVVFLEMWKASNPAAVDPYDWKRESSGTLIGLWWASWLAVALFGFYGVILAPGIAEDAANKQWENLGQMFAFVVSLVNTVLAMLVIYYLRQRQAKKYERLRSAGARECAEPVD